MKKNVKLLIIIAAAAVVLVGVMLLLIFLPKSGDNADPMDSIDPGIDMSTSVDGNGMHQATIKTNDKGEIENNSYGTLIDYVPAKISTKVKSDLKNSERKLEEFNRRRYTLAQEDCQGAFEYFKEQIKLEQGGN